MTRRKPALATRVSPTVNNAVRQRTKTLGITISEYLRKLILDDLESKQLLSNDFKKNIEEPPKNDRKLSPKNTIRKLLSDQDEEDYHERW